MSRRRPVRIVEWRAIDAYPGPVTTRRVAACVSTRERAERWVAREMKRCPWRMLDIVVPA